MLYYSVLLYNYHLNIIEEKLRNGSSVLDTNDVKFMKDIIQCFHRIWKCKKMYPKLNAVLDDETFQCIFNDISPNFSGNNEEFNVVCEYCDLEIPLLNNDLVFAYEMHQQTPEHIEIVNTFREFQSLSTSNASTLDFGQQNHVAERSVVSLDSGLGSQKEGGVDPQYTSLKKNYSNGENCIQTCNSNSVTLEVGKTQRRRKTSQKCDSEQRMLLPLMSILSSGESTQIISSIEDIYRSRCKIRLTYFLNKICIFLRFDNNQQYYKCGLCNFDLIDETHVKMHFLDSTHRTRATKVSKCNAKCASFEPCIFTDTKNEYIIDRHHLPCHLCMTVLPTSRYNRYKYLLHLQSKDHTEKVKAHFQLPIFEDWERGIVLRDGHPYCVYCDLVLPSLNSMKKHVKEPTHLNFAIQ